MNPSPEGYQTHFGPEEGLTLGLQPPEQLRCNFRWASDPPREFQMIVEGFHLLSDLYCTPVCLEVSETPADCSRSHT